MSRPFADVLRDLSGGSVYAELTDGLASIVQGVIEHSKAGEVTLKLKVRPNGEHSVVIDASVATKDPIPARGATIFYATAAGSLVRDDPRQQRLPLAVATGPARLEPTEAQPAQGEASATAAVGE